eukprot:m.229966 g.229966  ORF g.229966 m.229966 type:complete len:117 (+) comp26013_c0_seq2:1641-1991(+)
MCRENIEEKASLWGIIVCMQRVPNWQYTQAHVRLATKVTRNVPIANPLSSLMNLMALMCDNHESPPIVKQHRDAESEPRESCAVAKSRQWRRVERNHATVSVSRLRIIPQQNQRFR